MSSLALRDDGRVLIGGSFTIVNGVIRNRIARLNADGGLDQTFLNGMAGANNNVFSFAVQSDDRVLIGGSFTTFNGVSRNRIARLNADGSLDTTFLNGMAGTNGTVRSMAVQPDDRVLIGGDFGMVNGVSRLGIARLNADGSLDTTFLNGLPGPNLHVHTVALQDDGRVLIAGNFTMVNGVSRNQIARMNADGSLDTTFFNGLPGPSRGVSHLALQSDGRVLIGGFFGAVNGVARNLVARLYGSGPVAPVLTVEPSNQDSHDDCCAVFHVEATGTPLPYRWRKDGVDLFDGGNVSGAATDTLRLTNVSPADAGAYSVVVSNVLGEATSSDAVLTVSALPQCQVGTCDAELGCVVSAVPDGTGCSDGTDCTSDACQSGACLSGPCSCITAPDSDGDGYGDATGAVAHCDTSVPSGHVTNADDCDDTSSQMRPGASEICDDRRNDCSAAGWPALLDTDRDLVEDACDNCMSEVNTTQADGDHDGVGTAATTARPSPIRCRRPPTATCTATRATTVISTTTTRRRTQTGTASATRAKSTPTPTACSRTTAMRRSIRARAGAARIATTTARPTRTPSRVTATLMASVTPATTARRPRTRPRPTRTSTGPAMTATRARTATATAGGRRASASRRRPAPSMPVPKTGWTMPTATACAATRTTVLRSPIHRWIAMRMPGLRTSSATRTPTA